jgi:hypothetical protein
MCSRPNSDGAGGGVASATIVRAGRQGSFWPRLLLPLVGAATSLVIWTGTRLP